MHNDAEHAPPSKAGTSPPFLQNEGKAGPSTARFGGKNLDQPKQAGIATTRMREHKQARVATDQRSLLAPGSPVPWQGVVSRQEAAGSLLPPTAIRILVGSNLRANQTSCLIRRQGKLLLQKRTAQEHANLSFTKNMRAWQGAFSSHTLRDTPSRQAQLSPALQSSARCQGGGGANRPPRGKRTDRSTSAASPWRSDQTATERSTN